MWLRAGAYEPPRLLLRVRKYNNHAEGQWVIAAEAQIFLKKLNTSISLISNSCYMPKQEVFQVTPPNRFLHPQ